MKILLAAVFVSLHANLAYSFLCPQPLPNVTCPDPSEIKFNLYTENNNSYVEIFTGQLADISYNTGCSFIFITHGYRQNGSMPWILDMIYEFFQTGCLNIIVVDWSAITSTTDYYNASTDINLVYPYTAFRTCCSGEYVGALLVDLYNTSGVALSDMHCVGHSLGAHLFGCAGQYAKNQTGLQVGWISGMDPAGPLFNEIPTNCRLSSDDATFVDIIHTDRLLMGYATSLGHVDFYPNGGATQPGCPSTNYPNPIVCSHCYAYLLYNASIRNNGFISNTCSNYATYELGTCSHNAQTLLGYNVYKNATKKYFLDTLASSPYAKNDAPTASLD